MLDYWVGKENFKKLDDREFDNRIQKTITMQNKTQLVMFVEKDKSVPLNYIIMATHPEIKDYFHFGFNLNPSSNVRQMFRLSSEKFPILTAVSYSQENYMSGAMFVIKHYRGEPKMDKGKFL